MPAGIDDLIAAAAAECEAMLAELLELGSELTKQPKPDSNKSDARNNILAAARATAQRNRA